ncbi:flagellar assembly peptidoglycan hydrolase FlgJ [Marinobacter sp. X15-166B]|uniref:flagellar assembly peptidoglycan hydrolase FlgJ n=1 Tax=Marinobacter sp. X15-166B TaxID=1897620 RepID=UPI00085BBFC6|nr:flagellar assembly peptidoglycan hydrolase FlgJ [Marinobacter sp. X15-166B]OEY67364.1 flagellar rod assembly protein/muramidase FlgJ [Marinobacter sp. X15-166B]
MQDARLQQARVFTEFGGLNALKTQARTDKQAALEEVARQFESLFMAEMLKSMRQAGDVLAEGNYLNSEQSEFYRDMFDSQLSLSLSRNEGMGLAHTLVQQLSRQIPGMNAQGERLAGHRTSIQDYDRSLPALSIELPARLREVEQVAETMARPVPESEPAREDLPAEFTSPREFVRQLLPLAERVAADSGLNPRLMVAQAALETGWGKHMITGANGEPSYNLFGIKADRRWSGEAVNITTSEFREGVRLQERADFRAYDDYESSFRDYVSFLHANPRYREVLANADDPQVFARKLQSAGYATDPEYAAKISRIMSGKQFARAGEGAVGVSPRVGE